jgi:hypothetical protein
LSSLLLPLGNAAWSLNARRAMDSALDALITDAEVTMTEDEWIALQPAAAAPTRGLILFPGGYVDARAYAPVARLIAASGLLVVLLQPPCPSPCWEWTARTT